MAGSVVLWTRLVAAGETGERLLERAHPGRMGDCRGRKPAPRRRPGAPAFWQPSCLVLENDRSIGLSLGAYGGRYRSLAPAASDRRRTALASWLPRLSTTTISPCRSTGTCRARPTPVLLQRCYDVTTVDAATPNRAASDRQLSPPPTDVTTRSRTSFEVMTHHDGPSVQRAL